MDNDRVQKKESRLFRGSGQCGDFVVEMHKIVVMRGVPWEEALKLRLKHRSHGDGFYASTIGLNKGGKQGIAFIFGLGIGGEQAVGGGGNARVTAAGTARLYCVIRPNTGRSPRYETLDELMLRFNRVPDGQAEQMWREQFDGRVF